jgi:hypothetical protein
MNIDLKDFIEGNNDLFTLCTYKEAESVLNKFLEWHKEAISVTRCCEELVCERCAGKEEIECICVNCIEELW